MSGPFLFFTDLVGQAKAQELLLKSVAHAKISHAFLFNGPSGIGKRSMALAFSALINCQARNDHDACGKCPSCIKYRSGTHPDLLLIEPQGSAIKINQIRELKAALRFPPLEAQYRTVVLTKVHLMRREAANSLLKTLEEPRENTVLILTAQDSADILPTILSRCQVVPFFPLPYGDVSRILVQEGLPEDTAATLSAVSEGRLGLAKLLQQKNILAIRKEIIENLVQLTRASSGAIEPVFSLAAKAAQLKENLEELFDLLTIWIRDLMLQATGAENEHMMSCDLIPALDSVKGRWSVHELAEKLRHIDAAKRQLFRNCNRTLICEVLFFALL